MRKHILLAVGVGALILAAREYGITSLQDVKNKLADLKDNLGPYLKDIDLNELLSVEEDKNVA